MNVSSLRIRRSLTLAGALAALILGFAAIQAAAAWTATEAPLSVTPVSVNTLESKLQLEQARSADLQLQLRALSGNTEELSTALEAAQARIAADTKHAKDLEKDLKAAKKKLATLQKSIRVAAASATRVTAQATRTSTVARPAEDEREADDDD